MNEGILQQFMISVFGQSWRTSFYAALSFIAGAADLIQTYATDMGLSQPVLRTLTLLFGLLAMWNAKDRIVTGTVKSLVALLIAASMLFCPVSYAATKSVGLAWEQAVADTSSAGFAGWKIYRKTGTGTAAVYTLFATIPYVSQQTTYTTTQVLTIPDGTTGSVTFVATAYDSAGNESIYSNEAVYTYDLAPPATPINLRIVIQVN